MEIYANNETSFYVIIRKTDSRLFKHYTKEDAVKEAKRLAKHEQDTFFVLETVEAHVNVPRTMKVGLQSINYEPDDVKLDPLRHY